MDRREESLSFLKFLAASAIWEGNFSSFLQWLFMAGSNLQCIAILLSAGYLSLVTKSTQGISAIIFHICDFMSFGAAHIDTLSSFSGSTALLFSFICFMAFAVLLTVVIRSYLNHMSLKRNFLIFLTILGQIFVTLAFWPLTVMLLNLWINKSFHDQVATEYEISSAFLTVSSIIFTILNYIIGLFFALFSYDPFFSTNVLASHSPSFQVMTFFFKAVLAPIYTLLASPDTTVMWIFASGSLVILAFRQYDLFRNFPYFNYPAMKLALTSNVICLMIAIVNFILQALQSVVIFEAIVMILINFAVCIPAVFFWCIRLKNMTLAFLSIPVQDLQTEDMILKKFFALQDLIKHTKLSASDDSHAELPEIHFLGLLNAFNREQNAAEEQNHNWITSDVLANLQIKSFSEIMETMKWSLLEKFSQKIKIRPKLRILLVSALLDSSQRLSSLILYTSGLPKAVNIDGIIAHKLQCKAQERIATLLKEEKSDRLDYGCYIDAAIASENFLRLVHANSINYINFWKEYEKPGFIMLNLLKNSKIIEQEDDQIQSFWRRNITIDRSLASSLVPYYHVYLSLVRNQPMSAAKMLREYRSYSLNQSSPDKSRIISQDILNDQRTLLVHASVSEEHAGTIVRISSNVVELLGWTRHYILGKNISTLIPQVMKERHKSLIQRHLRKIKSPVIPTPLLNHQIDSFVVDKNRYILPCCVHICIHPHIQEELVYVGILQIKERNQEILLFNREGVVEGFTREIGKQFDIPLDRKFNLRNICMNYEGLEEFMEDSEEQYLSLALNFIQLQSKRRNIRRSSHFQYSAEIRRQHLVKEPLFVLTLKPQATEDDEQSIEIFNEIMTANSESENYIPDEKNLPDAQLVSPTILSQRKDESNRILVSQTERETLQYGYTTERTSSNRIFRTTTKDLNSPSPMRQFSAFAIKKKDKKDKDLIVKAEKEEEEDVASVTSVENSQRRLEQAVSGVPKYPAVNVLNAIFIVFILTISSSLSYFHSKNINTLTLLEGNTEVLSETTRMLSKLLDVNKIARYMVLCDAGIMNSSRYIYFGYITDPKPTYLRYFLDYTLEANNLSNSIRSSIYKIDSSLQDQLYEDRFPVYYQNGQGMLISNRTSNLFDLVPEIVAAGMSLAKTPVSLVNINNTNLQLILYNVLNDLILAGERIVPILVQDSHTKLKYQSTFLTTMLSIVSFIGIFCFVVLIGRSMQFVKRRQMLIDIFIRLDQEYITEHIKILEKFASLLEKNHFSSKSLGKKVNENSFTVPPVRTRFNKSDKKQPSLKGINMGLYKISILIFLLISILIMMFLGILLLHAHQRKGVSNKIKLMTETNNYLYLYTMLFDAQYEYIQLNDTTKLRNMPMDQELTMIFDELMTTQDFFLITLTSEGMTNRDAILNAIRGPLCDQISGISAKLQQSCKAVKGGVLQTGIVGLNSLILATVQQTMTLFQNSNRTTADIFAALTYSDLPVVENIVAQYTYKAYMLISTLIKDQIIYDLNHYKLLSRVFGITCILVGFVFGNLAWYRIKKLILEEFILWRKFITQIPITIVANNKILRNYLMKPPEDIDISSFMHR